MVVFRATFHDRCSFGRTIGHRDTGDSSAFDQQLRAFVVAEPVRRGTCTRILEADLRPGSLVGGGFLVGLGYGICIRVQKKRFTIPDEVNSNETFLNQSVIAHISGVSVSKPQFMCQIL